MYRSMRVRTDLLRLLAGVVVLTAVGLAEYWSVLSPLEQLQIVSASAAFLGGEVWARHRQKLGRATVADVIGFHAVGAVMALGALGLEPAAVAVMLAVLPVG